jgi:hypothetical protein
VYSFIRKEILSDVPENEQYESIGENQYVSSTFDVGEIVKRVLFNYDSDQMSKVYSEYMSGNLLPNKRYDQVPFELIFKDWLNRYVFIEDNFTKD